MGRNAESIATKRSHSLEISTTGAAQGARDQASERDMPSMPTPFPRLPAPLRTRPPVVCASRAPPAARVRWLLDPQDFDVLFDLLVFRTQDQLAIHLLQKSHDGYC